ncbi:hypothetical protein MGH68_04415 [Erysipelothrix sp. D19-032]
MDPVTLATQCMDRASEQIWAIIEQLIADYELERSFITLYGGGGSAGVITHYLGQKYDLKSKVVNNAPYISTIGVALAMITEQIERSVVNPNEDDIKRIRGDIIDKMLEMGALRETIEVSIEVDTLNNVLIANASGTNEIKNNDVAVVVQSHEELKKIAVQSLGYESVKQPSSLKMNALLGLK